jgi:hypothetical protein
MTKHPKRPRDSNQLAMGFEDLPDAFRWQGDGVAAAHAYALPARLSFNHAV